MVCGLLVRSSLSLPLDHRFPHANHQIAKIAHAHAKPAATLKRKWAVMAIHRLLSARWLGYRWGSELARARDLRIALLGA